jgi:hypothetical protein
MSDGRVVAQENWAKVEHFFECAKLISNSSTLPPS